MQKFEKFSSLERYAIATLLVVAAFMLRALLQPQLGPSHPYSVFVPPVLISAYFLGRRPAILAAALSVTLGYSVFVAPSLPWTIDTRIAAPLCMFLLSSTVGIYFITGMRRALRALGESQARAQALAESHAVLFRELNERVTNHLQLVAAVLQLQARNEQNAAVAGALAEASGRTLTISKVHRSLTNDQNEPLDFETFAAQLLKGALAARGQSTQEVILDATGIRLAPDQATSVALVLLECLKSQLDAGGASPLRIRMRGDDLRVRVQVYGPCADETAGAAVDPLIAAMVEQLSGTFTQTIDAEGSVWELDFPRDASPAPLARAPAMAHTPNTFH